MPEPFLDSPDSLPLLHYPAGPSGPHTVNESAREPSGDQTAVSERYSYQPNSSNSYPDVLGTIDHFSHNYIKQYPDWVPEVIEKYGVFVVGTGQIKDKRCGRKLPFGDDSAGACQIEPDKHKPLLLPIGCSRRECPEDWIRWAHKAGRRISNTVNGYLNARLREARETNPDFNLRYLPDHISIHPPKDLVIKLVEKTLAVLEKKGILQTDYMASKEFHKIFLKKYQAQEKKAIDLLGLKACVSVNHPIRLKQFEEEDTADVNQDTNRYRRVLDHEDWDECIVFAPHSHIITDGSYLPSAQEFYDKTKGWTYRNHREISDIERLVEYLVSHASAVPGKHTIRYLGEYQWRLSVEGTIKVDTFIPCPECLANNVKPSDCTYVVGKIGDINYERDDDGHNQMVSWNWLEIYEKHFIKRARIIPVFRLLKPGEKRVPIERLHGKPLEIEYYSWIKLKDNQKKVCRWIKHYSTEEWQALPDNEKPWWWI